MSPSSAIMYHYQMWLSRDQTKSVFYCYSCRAQTDTKPDISNNICFPYLYHSDKFNLAIDIQELGRTFVVFIEIFHFQLENFETPTRPSR